MCMCETYCVIQCFQIVFGVIESGITKSTCGIVHTWFYKKNGKNTMDKVMLFCWMCLIVSGT